MDKYIKAVLAVIFFLCSCLAVKSWERFGIAR